MSVRYNTLNLFCGGQTVKVLKIYQHKEYYPEKEYLNDIALLKTFRMSLKHTNAKEIKLPSKDYNPSVGTMLNMTGFGLSEQNPYYYNDRLKIANISVRRRGECRGFYAYITKKQFCAGGNKINSGYGDAGGPASKDQTLIGIILTENDKTENLPDLFTNVGSYVTWIKKYIKWNI